ncbi:phosphatidylinositol-specific phospholipase C/glycerophosphodiester phosphodiesterase family protein [Actinophytocola oryzae]|uniref:Altered inheritance of mitochondria protein 6 n=1 Tax=Actinophytocola oryzae TaxID=502181 RepID=A0A4R7V748_9PSEU|nr:phosphatidylinositol-specific phospholipase C/glycerophosphodiester phosphodiesterase family protein [Actinophytocola oryzae]TDV44870.1 glycerophosphoryl diester phosphodiesterase family protein [Actinophytocola oryzae]
MRRSLLLLTVVLGLVGGALPAGATTHERVRPLAQAHAHNDYDHPRPLFDALDQGFTSVEADIYLVGTELLVAHDPEDLDPARTLSTLYLDPLRDRVVRNHGAVYLGHRDFQLLIDIKTEGESTYAALDTLLRAPRYAFLWTAFRHGRVRHGAVTAVVSGNRPRATMEAQPTRVAFYDGRIANPTDLGPGSDARLTPLVSDNWTTLFTWRGVGAMPAAERARLRAIVRTAHRAGQRVRFWETPDASGAARDAVWRELVAAHVDHLNTDDLAGLAEFLRQSVR